MRKPNIRKLNKKGFSMISESDKILFWFIVVGVIMLCVVLIVAWTSTLRKMYLNDALQPTTYEARLIYSDKCFAYKDSVTGRVYTGTIDPSKFNQDVLNKCVPFEGISGRALSVQLLQGTKEGVKPEINMKLTSPNWNLKTESVTVNKYPVFIQGYGSGTLTFLHQGGE